MAKKKSTPEAAPAQPEQAAEPAYKFTTLNQVVEDPYFIDALKVIINTHNYSRGKILKESAAGTRLRRTAYDELYDRGLLNPTNVREIFVDIIHQRSKEGARVRDFVSAIGGEAVTQTINHYPLVKEETNEQ